MSSVHNNMSLCGLFSNTYMEPGLLLPSNAEYIETTLWKSLNNNAEKDMSLDVPTGQDMLLTVTPAIDSVSKHSGGVHLPLYHASKLTFREPVVKPIVLANAALSAATLAECGLRAFQHTSLDQQKLVFDFNGNRLILVYQPNRYLLEGFTRVVLVDVDADRNRSLDYFSSQDWFNSDFHPGLVQTVRTWAARLNGI